MQANYVQRIRLIFSKQGPARFIGHLDVARTLERSLNRAQVPVAYTQGFNRRPRLSIAAALPLGYTSDYELADIWLAEAVSPETVQKLLAQGVAPGITIIQAQEIPLSSPSVQSVMVSANYEAIMLDKIESSDIRSSIDDLMAAESIIRTRKKKKGKTQEYDLRPLILTLDVADGEQEGIPVIHMHLQQSVGKTGRPDEVLSALGFDPLGARFNRTHIYLTNNN